MIMHFSTWSLVGGAVYKHHGTLGSMTLTQGSVLPRVDFEHV